MLAAKIPRPSNCLPVRSNLHWYGQLLEIYSAAPVTCGKLALQQTLSLTIPDPVKIFVSEVKLIPRNMLDIGKAVVFDGSNIIRIDHEAVL